MNWKFWKKQEISEEVKPEIVPYPKPEPEPDISEPVYSLYNEIVHNVESWEYKIEYSEFAYGNAIKLKHKNKDIELTFRHSASIEVRIVCSNEFLTKDESLYLGKAFDIWYKKYTDNLEIERKTKTNLSESVLLWS